MRLACPVLLLAGMALFIGTLWSASDDSIHLSGDEAHAQGSGIGRVHLPVVARGAPVGGGPSEPMPWRPDANFVIGGPAWTVNVVGDVAFVGVGAHLMAYDISGDPPLSLLGASPPLPGSVRDVVVSDGFAFAAVHQTTELADVQGGLFVLDVRDPTAIEVVANRELRRGATDLDLNGDRVVVTAMSKYSPRRGQAWFVVFDVSNPRRPDLIRTAPSGAFGGEGDIVLHDEIVFACSEGILVAFDMRLPIDSWFLGRRLGPCAVMARIGSDGLLAVVSDSLDTGSDEPMLRIFDVRDISMVEVIGETPLRGWDIPDAWIHALEVRAAGSSVYVAGLIDESRGGIFHFDVSDPTVPRTKATWTGEGATMSADADGGPIFAAGATFADGPFDFYSDFFATKHPYALGSRIEVLEEVGDGSLRSLTKLDGPGILLSTVTCHDATAYVFDISTSDSGGGRLWAFNNADAMPSVSATLDLPQVKNVLYAGAIGVVASPTGLFVRTSGQISRYQVRDGRLEFMGSVDDAGTLAVSGDNLFVLAKNEELRVYDSSVPSPWRHVAALELPTFGRRYLGPPAVIASKNHLWMTTTPGDPYSTPVILADISDITDVRLIGTLDLFTENGGPEHAWLGGGDGAVWLLTTDWQLGSLRTTISTLSVSPDGSGAIMDTRWFADSTRESIGFPWALAILEDRAWYVSQFFNAGQGSVHAVERTKTGDLKLAGTRAAPAAVRARSTGLFHEMSHSLGALSLATCGDRIFGTDIEGGLYGIDPERWLEGVGEH